MTEAVIVATARSPIGRWADPKHMGDVPRQLTALFHGGNTVSLRRRQR